MADTHAAYFIKGKDPSLLADALTHLLDRLRAEGREIEDVAVDASGSAVGEICNARFLGDPDKVVVVRDVDTDRFRADDIKALSAYLSDPNPSTVLVMVAGQGRAIARFDALVAKAGEVIDAGVPAERDRVTFVVSRCKEQGLKVPREVCQLIATHLGEDIGRLPSMVDVLEAAHGKGATITAEMVEPLLGTRGGSTPWALTDAIDRGDTRGAMEHLERMLTTRHPFQVMATLTTHYQRQLRLDDPAITGQKGVEYATGLKGFPAKKALQTHRRLGGNGAARAVELLAGADLDLRGVKEWPDRLVLEVLVARLSKLTARR